MKGAIIKDLIQKEGYSISKMAEILGTYQQKLDYELKKDDVRSSLIEEVAEALNIPISKFYGDSYVITGNNNATAINNSVANANDDKLMNLLINKDEQLTMAMKQTSKAQSQMDELIAIMKESCSHNSEV